MRAATTSRRDTFVEGQITIEPDFRQTRSGIPVCSFYVRTKRETIGCVAWRDFAEKAKDMKIDDYVQVKGYYRQEDDQLVVRLMRIMPKGGGETKVITEASPKEKENDKYMQAYYENQGLCRPIDALGLRQQTDCLKTDTGWITKLGYCQRVLGAENLGTEMKFRGAHHDLTRARDVIDQIFAGCRGLAEKQGNIRNGALI